MVHATVPNAPGSYLGVSKLDDTNTSVRFSLKDNSNNEDGFYLSVYNLDQTPFATIAIPASDEEYVYANLTGLTCNATYKAIAVAYNTDGNSSQSDWATFNIARTFNAKCPDDINTTPNQPGPYIGVTSLNQSTSSVRVSLKDNSDNEDGFRIFGNDGINITLPANDESQHPYVYTNLTGLDCTTLYTLQAVAIKDGVESIPTPVRTFNINTTFAIPCDGNSAPIADAGSNLTLPFQEGGVTVQLDASNSNDADGDPLTYTWLLLSTPDQSSATLSDPTLVNPTLSTDLAGEYRVQLIVNDGKVDSLADVVTITINDSRDDEGEESPVPECIDPTTLIPEFD